LEITTLFNKFNKRIPGQTKQQLCCRQSIYINLLCTRYAFVMLISKIVPPVL